MQQHDSNFILIKAQQAWATSQANGIKVFVLDTGIDSDHPDLKDNFKGGISFVPSESSHKDFAGHGTHVAGTIGATMTGSGIVGVAPKSYLYAVKVLASNGSGNWSWLISGIDWVMQKKGLRIINMSLGGSSAPQAVKDMGLSGFLQRNNCAYDFFKEGMPIIYSLRSHQPSPVAGVGGCEGNKLYSIW